jgi:uncharacterized protein (TIGR03083 family)
VSTAERPALRLPAGLRQRVLAAAEQARAAGRSVPDVEDISPVEGFRRAVDALDDLLRTVPPRDWSVPVVNGFDGQGLVGHLIGVELDFHRSIEGDAAVADLDHVGSTRAAAARQLGLSPARTRAEWRRTTERTLRRVEFAELDSELALHGLRASLGTVLVIRAFELWTHENDIRRALGLAARAPDGSTLRLMTAVAAGALPLAAAGVGLDEPTRVRLVLTGVGGGTWTVELGRASADPVAVRIVADAVAFCQLAADRVRPDELEPDLSGDLDRAAAVLRAVPALALD